jgi:uncharacterized membrane protein YeiH
VALVTWTTPLAWWPNSAIDWFDAVGIAAYGAAGAASALSHGISPLSAAILGVFTACLGGGAARGDAYDNDLAASVSQLTFVR